MATLRLDAQPVIFGGRTVIDAWVGHSNIKLSPDDARKLAHLLSRAVETARRGPGTHERHVNLTASCFLCVAEAGPGHRWPTGVED